MSAPSGGGSFPSAAPSVRWAGGEVMVVGSGTRFISGVSHYTRYLVTALAAYAPTSAILMRGLIPRRFYPGRQRVGAQLTGESYPADVPVYDGIDWYWGPSMAGGLRFLLRRRPRLVVFQWWTGAVLHSYLLLAAVARARGATIVVELHEIQDTGEARVKGARRYAETLGRSFMGMADAFVVHSEFDREALAASFDVGGREVRVSHHGPFSHYSAADAVPLRDAPAGRCNYLYFGTIRPYKGVEHLVRAFELLADEDPAGVWLTVVGETWEGWTQPAELIARSRHRERITLVNEYVTDEHAARWLAGADVIVLPYLRSSASGPLHVATEIGVPLVVTDVGGLAEAAQGYDGAVLAAAGSPEDLARAMRHAHGLRGRRFDSHGSWERSAATLLELAASHR